MQEAGRLRRSIKSGRPHNPGAVGAIWVEVCRLARRGLLGVTGGSSAPVPGAPPPVDGRRRAAEHDGPARRGQRSLVGVGSVYLTTRSFLVMLMAAISRLSWAALPCSCAASCSEHDPKIQPAGLASGGGDAVRARVDSSQSIGAAGRRGATVLVLWNGAVTAFEDFYGTPISRCCGTSSSPRNAA